MIKRKKNRENTNEIELKIREQGLLIDKVKFKSLKSLGEYINKILNKGAK